MEQHYVSIDLEENVARLLCNEWVDDGYISVDAFALAPKETYLSVNRPAVDTFNDDVKKFVTIHQDFVEVKDDELTFCAAMMNVGDIKAIAVEKDGRLLDVDVEIESRDAHTKSHAGIFVRSGGVNIVKGRNIKSISALRGVSSDDILMEVQWSLKDTASLEMHFLPQH